MSALLRTARQPTMMIALLLACLLSVLAGTAIASGGLRGKVPCFKHNDADSTENDTEWVPREPDYHDAILLPEAWHEVQHFEWLGGFVDEEPAPEQDDDVAGKTGDDDGLLSLKIGGGRAVVHFEASSNFHDHPQYFPRDSSVYVDAWIDWNGNGVFAPAEHLGTWSGNPRNETDWPVPPGPRTVFQKIVGAAQGPIGHYNVRLRLDWHEDDDPHVPMPEGNGSTANPSTTHSWGEVEDYVDYLATELEPYEIPTMTFYGMVILSLFLVAAAVVVLLKRGRLQRA